jgi:hypothetical protein
MLGVDRQARTRIMAEDEARARGQGAVRGPQQGTSERAGAANEKK